MTLSLSNVVCAKDCVVLLHGLARTSVSMNPVGDALVEEGYKVINVGYPSTDYTIEELSPVFVRRGVEACKEYDRIHFVTHSMGGILVRYFMKNFEKPRGLGHVVMMAPPNKGSELVNALGGVPGYSWWNGPSGSQLSVDADSVPNTLGPVDFSLGVIAGNRKTAILSNFITGPNDGKVSVESSKVSGMSDHVTVYVSHTFIMRKWGVKQHIISFLKNGEFVD